MSVCAEYTWAGTTCSSRPGSTRFVGLAVTMTVCAFTARASSPSSMPFAYGQCSSRACSREYTTSVAVTGVASDHMSCGRSSYLQPRPFGSGSHAIATPAVGSSVLGSSAVSVGYWMFQTSRATVLSPTRGSSEPMVPGVPTVIRSGGAGAATPVKSTPNATTANAANALRTTPSSPFAVAHDLTRRVHAGDAGDTAAAVGRAARLVETGDRRTKVGVSGRGSHVEQLVG